MADEIISFWDDPYFFPEVEEPSEEDEEEARRKAEEERRLKEEEERKQAEEQILAAEQPSQQDKDVVVSFWDDPYFFPELAKQAPPVSGQETTTLPPQEAEASPYIIERKLKYGWAQEPTIAGSLWRLGKAKLTSLVSDKTYEEAARDIEAERQVKIAKDFPELIGMEEDGVVLAGRMALAISDPVTLFIPWLKLAKAGKLAVAGVGAAVATGDIALREKALYGEINPLSLGLAAGLGAGSSVLASVLMPANKGIRKTFETINDKGTKVLKRVDVGGGATIQNPLLTIRNKKKLIEESLKTGDEIVSQHSKIINNLIESNNNAGFYFAERKIAEGEIRIARKELNTLLTKHEGLEIAEVTAARNRLLKHEEKFEEFTTKLQNILFNELPEDFAQSGLIQFNQAFKNGLLGDEAMVQWFMQELTRPIIGGLGGLAMGVTTADEDDSMSYVYALVGLGAGLGRFSTLLNRGTGKYSGAYKLTATKAKEAGDIIYKRAFMSLANRITSGTHSAKLQTGVRAVREFGAKMFNLQGGGLKLSGVALGETVEEAKMLQIHKWGTVALNEVIGNASESTMLAAGRILNQKNMSDRAVHSFLHKGDLENTEAVKLADDLDRLTNNFKDYVKSVGIQLNEVDEYGLTQILRKNLKGNKKKSLEDLSEAFKIQFLNDWKTNKLQLQSQGPLQGRYVHIEDLKRLKPTEVVSEANVRNYSKVFIDDALGKKSKTPLLTDFNKWADNKATNYFRGQTERRKTSLWATDEQLDFLDPASFKQKMFRDRGEKEEELIINAARHFEKERVLYDQEARAFLSKKNYFETDPTLTFQTLVNETIPVVEFARIFGAKGEAIQDVFKNIKLNINAAAKGKATIDNNSSLEALARQQIKDVKDSLDAYFGLLHVNNTVIKSDKAMTVVAVLQAVLSTTKLTKVALPSLGDLIQTFKNSGFGAAREASIKQMARRRGEDTWIPSELLGLRAKRPVADQLSSDTSISDILWNKRLYNGLLEREMKNWMIEIDPTNRIQVAAQKYQQRFFEIVQLGRITRFAREFAYDAGAIRAWQISQKLNKSGKLSRKYKSEIERLGLSEDSAQYLNKFKSLDDIEGDAFGERLITRAGFKSAERDALIPTVGNRRLFSQSRDPTLRFLGSFLSWAQAKTSQTNALISRVEAGEGAMAIRMLAAMPIFMAVRDLQLELNSSQGFAEEAAESKNRNISNELKQFGDTLIFSAEIIPWYIDKAINELRFTGGEGPVTGLAPVMDLMNNLATEGSQTVFDGILSANPDKFVGGWMGTLENTIPFFKDLNRAKGFLNPVATFATGKPVGVDLEDWLKGERYGPLESIYGEDSPFLQDQYPEEEPEDIYGGGGFFEGGKVSKDYPVPNAPVVPMERKDKLGNQSYATQASAAPINPFTGKPYTDIYNKG